MAEFGIWVDEDGGFAETGFRSSEQAQQGIGDLVFAEPYLRDYTLSVVEICPDHEEQPKEGCEECDAEPGEDDADDDESDSLSHAA
ncbi:hypothetical protein [Nonomuraea guangzhouensis]|uniref:Uncharacterized protein n=1 Tax=Nonomuraea guangzhouensis TaxID=1291555 RepID=A0ABW4GVT6_9ACTN|nr:hypothetical protein [Nonomuraea guangzhouensis]